MSGAGVTLGSLAFAAAVGLLAYDLLAWLMGRISPDRLAWCQLLVSGGTFWGTR